MSTKAKQRLSVSDVDQTTDAEIDEGSARGNAFDW
jgi:hypothetical protein